LKWEGVITADLDAAVPHITRWRLDSIPKHLPWEDVEKIIDLAGREHADGKRDRAMLLLIARCGLRAHDVRTLELRHIWWRRGEILLPETKGRKERVLPIPKEVGHALADYVLHGRPQVKLAQVFVRHRAPYGPLTSSAAVAGVVRKYMKRAGIREYHRGAHVLRHSLATRMVNAGVPIKSIADVLGHASIDTTAIYTKVDIAHLASVALPMPEVQP
jgi:site-specific recombinase XerD